MEFVFEYIRLLVSFINFFIVFKNFIRLKIRWYESVLFTIAVTLSLEVIYALVSPPPYMMSLYVSTTMVIFAYYKQKYLLNSVLSGVLAFTLMLSIHGAIVSIFMFTFSLSVREIAENVFTYWSITLVVFGITYAISKTFGRYMPNPRQIELNRKFLILAQLFLAGILTAFYAVIFLPEGLRTPEVLHMIVSALLIIVFSVFSVLCYAFYHFVLKDMELKATEEKLDDFHSYHLSISNLHDDLRRLYHDNHSIFSTAYTFIEKDDFEGWKECFENKITPLFKKTPKQLDIIKQINHIQSEEIKGMLTVKLLTAHNENINVQIGIEEDIYNENIGFCTIDFVRVVGILLENAREECIKGTDMLLQFVMYKTDTHTVLLVANELFEEVPNTSKIYKNGYSTKGKERGIGLSSLKEIISEYSNITLQTYIDETKGKREFVQKITIPLTHP